MARESRTERTGNQTGKEHMNIDKLISTPPQEIARLYRDAVFRQRRAPIATQWLFGAEIKRFKDAFYITSEERRLFR
jgi:hypothetical protein